MVERDLRIPCVSIQREPCNQKGLKSSEKTYFAVRGRNLGEDGQERSDEIQEPDWRVVWLVFGTQRAENEDVHPLMVEESKPRSGWGSANGGGDRADTSRVFK